MSEEYLIAKLMEICAIPYNFAQSIIIDLEERELLNHLKLNLDKFEDFQDVFDTYYRNYLTKENER